MPENRMNDTNLWSCIVSGQDEVWEEGSLTFNYMDLACYKCSMELQLCPHLPTALPWIWLYVRPYFYPAASSVVAYSIYLLCQHPQTAKKGCTFLTAEVFHTLQSRQQVFPFCVVNMDTFEEDLTCSICYSIFEDPRVLPCSHTFCRPCLENIIHESGNFSIWRSPQIPLKCPTCRSIVDLPPVGAGSLPINFSLMGIIEKYQKEEQPKIPNCPEHKQPLNMFCLLDRKLVCGYCLTLGQHQRHSVDDLQNAYVKEKEKASKLVDQLTDKRWVELSIFIEKLEHEKLQAEHILQGDKEIVIQYFEDLQKTIEAKKHALLAILYDVNLKITNEYGPVIQKMKELKEEQHNLITFSTYVEEEEDPLMYLEKNSHIPTEDEYIDNNTASSHSPTEYTPTSWAISD